MTTRRTLLAGAGAAFALALAGPVRAAGPMVLGMRHDGRRLENGDITGWALVYFGYTFCPDVCPLGLQTIAEALDALGPLAEKLTPVFVTVDPERDTPEVLKAYTAAFDPSFIGLYGDLERTAQIAKDFKVYYKKMPTGSSYTMDHTSLSYVYDPLGKLRLALRHEQPAQDYADDIRKLLNPA